MKKIVRFMLILAIVFSLPMSLRAADASAYYGQWYGELYGMIMSLTINEDGTYEMLITGSEEPSPGTWELKDGALIMDGDEKSPLVFDGTNLVSESAEEDGMKLVFGREPIEEKVFAEPKADATIEEYAGKWEAHTVQFFGMTMDAVAANLDLRLEIEGNVVTMNSTGLSFTDEKAECEFHDGVLQLDAMKALNEAKAALGTSEAAEETDATEETQEGSVGYTYTLLSDGMLKASIDLYGEAAVFYLDSVEEFSEVPAPAAEESGAAETTAAAEEPAAEETTAAAEESAA